MRKFLRSFLTSVTALLKKVDVQTNTFNFVLTQDEGDEVDFSVAVAFDAKSMGDVLQKVEDKKKRDSCRVPAM